MNLFFEELLNYSSFLKLYLSEVYAGAVVSSLLWCYWKNDLDVPMLVEQFKEQLGIATMDWR